MSRNAICRLVGIVALMLAASVPVFAECSAHTVRGAWAFQGQGTALMTIPGAATPTPVPFVSLGTMSIDRHGRYKGKGTISIGGQVQEVEYAGAIQVNPDCTAIETGTVGPLQTAGRLIILDKGNEMRELPTTHPLGPVTELAYFRRISWGKPHCTQDTVRGVYGGSGNGTFMVPVPGQPAPVPMPFSGIFTMSFDGEGTGSGRATASLGGGLAEVEFPELTLTVNRDCTATLKYNGVVAQAPDQSFSGTLEYIVLNHGDELIGMETESSIGQPIELESHKRISMVPPDSDR